MTDSGVLRLRIDGDEEIVVDLGRDQAPPATHQEPQVTSLRLRPSDHAAGIGRYEVTIDGWVVRVSVTDAGREDLRDRATRAVAPGVHTGDRVILRAQIPGRVIRMWVEPGVSVEAGQRLLAVEAMKMENEVRAPIAGTVERIAVGLGTSVDLGDELITIG